MVRFCYEADATANRRVKRSDTNKKSTAKERFGEMKQREKVMRV